MTKPGMKYTKLGSDEFKRLQGKWYDKLKAEGFDDLERTHDGDFIESSPYMKGHSGHVKRKFKRGNWLKNEELYRQAAMWCHDRDDTFDDKPWWGPAWELFSEGNTNNYIVTTLRSNGYSLSHRSYSKFRDAEIEKMQEYYRPKTVTAEQGERVYVKAVLMDAVADYVWEVQLPNGQYVEIAEEDMSYGK